MYSTSCCWPGELGKSLSIFEHYKVLNKNVQFGIWGKFSLLSYSFPLTFFFFSVNLLGEEKEITFPGPLKWAAVIFLFFTWLNVAYDSSFF